MAILYNCPGHRVNLRSKFVFLCRKGILWMAACTNASRIFLSYAAEDETLAAELVSHLSPLKRLGLISTWDNQHILAGTERSQIIDEHLEQAAIIRLLISANFPYADYRYELE